MEQQILVGCGPLPAKRASNLAELGCAEILDSIFSPVRPATLRRWNDERPAGFHYVLAASRWIGLEPLDEPTSPPAEFPRESFGLFRPTDANRHLWAEVHAQMETLRGDAVLLKSPPAFSPSTSNLENLRAFRREVIGPVGYDVVWEPRGIWNATELAVLAEELEMQIATDPYADGRLGAASEGAYLVVTAPAGHIRFSADDLFELSEHLLAHRGLVRVMFRGPERVANALALSKTLSKLRGDAHP